MSYNVCPIQPSQEGWTQAALQLSNPFFAVPYFLHRAYWAETANGGFTQASFSTDWPPPQT